MHTLALEHGETPWTAALIPLSVDGMIIASSMSLLLDSRRGIRSGALPWLLLLIGSSASLAANVAVAEPTPYGRIIAASGPAAARDILTAYAGLPLAIRIAAGRLAANPQWPLRHLAAAAADAVPRPSPPLRPGAGGHAPRPSGGPCHDQPAA
jgi:hypothetical protein